jgi:hypothetical protein
MSILSSLAMALSPGFFIGYFSITRVEHHIESRLGASQHSRHGLCTSCQDDVFEISLGPWSPNKLTGLVVATDLGTNISFEIKVQNLHALIL